MFPNKKRVLFLITGLGRGGAEAQLTQLALRLRARGWEVKVVSIIPPQAYEEMLHAAGIPVISLGVRTKIPTLKPVVRLGGEIRRWRPQIIHAHMVHANLLARIVRLLAPVPVLICTVHSIDEEGRVREYFYRLTDSLCDLTTQVSSAGLKRYVHQGAVPRHKIQYIPNGIDVSRFRPNDKTRIALREKLGLQGRFVWLAVGRFYPAKDYPTMLRAFAEVSRKSHEAILLVVGEGPLRPAIEGLARDLQVQEKVRFLGVRQDVAELMNVADAYVMSSAWEGMPMVLLEASACGLPIVATNVGGNSEVIVEGETGFLVVPQDPGALTQAMLRIMRLPKTARRQMGQKARAHVKAHFDMERIVDRWEDLYRRLLRERGVTIK